jgi:trans-aconitate methyltransferase
VESSRTVLDIGCGSGRLTAELLARLPGARIIAVDLSRNMLLEARKHLAPQFADRVSFVQADMQDLPFREIADGVFSAAAFHWAPDHERLFAGLLRALRPGGWLEAQCGGGPNLQRLRDRVRIIAGCPEYCDYFAGWQNPWEYASPEITAERMRHAGFTHVRTWLESSPAVMADAQEFKDYLATVTLHRHLERIPEGPLRQRFLDELARHSSQDEPPFEMDYWRLNMSGRKPQ